VFTRTVSVTAGETRPGGGGQRMTTVTASNVAGGTTFGCMPYTSTVRE